MTRWLTIVCVVLLYAVSAKAQNGQVTGTVVDQAGLGVPGATVQIAGAAGRDLTTSGATGSYRFAGLKAGTYRVTVSLVGFSQAVSDVVVSEAGTVVPPLTLKLASLTENVVVSATRNGTPLIDAPATMTVLTSAELQSSPAQNYGDLLRSVPGLNVIQLSARDVNITSRQATGTLSNTQLVLLDGRSVYLDFFGVVLWDLMPANLDNIKQIEVVRGPASAVWGANALTGVVNIITKSPREAPGSEATFTGGFMSRDAGSSVGKGVGGLVGANASLADAPNATWSYRVSGGYFAADAFPRPSGTIPIITDPRDPTGRTTVGGATYPADGAGPFGTAFSNRGANQPKFDARVDQELGSNGRLTYEGGVAGTQGVIYTGVGPFDIQSGSTLSFGRINYSRDALKINFFVNRLHAEAPNLLFPDAATGQPLLMNLTTKTWDFEAGDAFPVGSRQVLSVGGNVRRNNFDITLAPQAQDRSELGAYVQDEIFFLDWVRFNIGGRVDKFGNLSDPFFSPRLSANFKVLPQQAVRVSFNRAFRSPSVINNYLLANIISPVDLRGLQPFLPPQLRPLAVAQFPLVVRAVGSELPIGGVPQTKLTEQSLSAYEIAYTGTIQNRTTIGASFYINDLNHSINFVPLDPHLDPYTAANPPPGWQLPPSILTALAPNIVFPRTAFTYLNLGPIRQKGVELSLDQRVSNTLSAFVNYSWQGQPEILSDPNPYPTSELDVPPTNRFNAGFNVDDGHWLGNLSVNYSDKAFWSDVLTSPFHGYTDAYTMVNGAVGARWMNGKLTTSVKVTNLFNRDIQQHIFGDILKRMVVFEVHVKP
jgi:iron complex outermembrane receptor protein